jgi:hypothetical protein
LPKCCRRKRVAGSRILCLLTSKYTHSTSVYFPCVLFLYLNVFAIIPKLVLSQK